ncbi:MAG: hypothetical protein HYX47_19580 [Burkholderiales bacterium]|nr:hypothetical protein [Burkholderiales bacterium]
MTQQRRWLWWLIAALVAAQTLGLVHRIAHSSPTAFASAAPAASDSGHGWLASLFTGHDDDSGCRVYDQLGHADGIAPLAAIAPAMAVALFLLPFFQGEALARWAALFEARGPPQPR